VPTRIFTTNEFDRFARKERVADAALIDAIERVERGLIDADLGGGLLKLRIPRPGQGRRDGYRTIVACVVSERAFYLLGYGKNELDNIGDMTLRNFRLNASALQGLVENELQALLGSGQLREILR